MLDVPSKRLERFVHDAETEDLVNQVTAFRAGMRPDVLPLIEAELRRRGIGPDDVAAHQAEVDAAVIWQAPGLARKCRDCERPAVETRWDWHRLWNTVPILPARFYYCVAHCPRDEEPDA